MNELNNPQNEENANVADPASDINEYENVTQPIDKGVLKRAEFRKQTQDGEDKPKPIQTAIVEDSLSLRIAAFFLVTTVIFSSGLYAHTVPAITSFYLWLAGMGIFLSYRYRDERPVWVSFIPFVGAVLVISAFAWITYQQIMAHYPNFVGPFLQVLAGLQALHCFDLRSRDDFSVSALIAIGVFSFSAIAASDWSFLVLLCVFIVSLTSLLYFDSVSRSKQVGPSRPVGEGRPASLPKPIAIRSARAASMTVLLPILCVPLITMMLFYVIPKKESLIEWLVRDLIGPHFAISNSSRDTGYNPNVSRGGGGKSATIGTGGGQGGGQGKKPVGGSSMSSSSSSGDPDKAVGPLGRKDGKGENVSGVAGQTGGQGGTEEKFEETTEEENEEVDLFKTKLPANKIVMRIHAPRNSYTRRTTYDYYDGKSWKRRGPIKGVKFFKDRGNVIAIGNANALLVPSDCPTVEVRQQITVDVESVGKFLPAYWIPQAAGGNFDSLTVQADGALRLSNKFGDGATYEVVSLVPIYKLNDMRNLPKRTRSHFKESIFGPPVNELKSSEEALVEKYLQLPSDIPDKIKVLSKKVAGKKGNWFVQAERISKYLKKNCKYTTVVKNRSDKGDFVYNFLYKTRKGNCLDFASAFVVMCRAAGIPARCVGGYLPGKYNKGTGFYEVKVRDGHAWGEIYLPDWSWIPFDSSPVGSYPEVEKEDNFFSKLAEMGLSHPFGGALSKPAPSLGAGLGNGISGSELEKDINKSKSGSKPGEKDKDDKNEIENPLEYLTDFRFEPLVIVLIIFGTGYVAFMIMRNRKQDDLPVIPENAKRSTLIYLEVIGDLKRYQFVRLPYETPGDIKSRIHSVFELNRSEGLDIPEDLEPLLEQFIETYNLDRFGRIERVDELEAMSENIKQLVKSSRKK